MILQLVVDELVRKKRGEPLRKPSDRERKPRPQLRRRPPPAPKPVPQLVPVVKSPEEEDHVEPSAAPAPAPKLVVKSKKTTAPSGADLAQDLAASAFASGDGAFGDVDEVKNGRVFAAMGDDDL